MRLQNLMDTWNGLDARRKLVVLVATLAVFAAVLVLSRMATAPGMTLLYAGLEPSAAGEVVTSLDQRGVAYEIRGGAIYVDSARRDELRMTLASEGLPANGGQGYEILDGLSGFGTTSQMFDAAYWPARSSLRPGCGRRGCISPTRRPRASGATPRPRPRSLSRPMAGG